MVESSGDTYRVISLDIYKTENAYHYNMTLADNSTKDDGWHIIDHKHQVVRISFIWQKVKVITLVLEPGLQ